MAATAGGKTPISILAMSGLTEVVALSSALAAAVALAAAGLTGAMRNAWASALKRHHAIHHRRDETVSFGVTTTVWDHVFRTVWSREGVREPQGLAA